MPISLLLDQLILSSIQSAQNFIYQILRIFFKEALYIFLQLLLISSEWIMLKKTTSQVSADAIRVEKYMRFATLVVTKECLMYTMLF